MNPEAIRAALAPHAKRPIRAFLDRPGEDDAEDAFWAAVYAKMPAVEHAEAMRLSRELESSPAPVSSVLEGLPA